MGKDTAPIKDDSIHTGKGKRHFFDFKKFELIDWTYGAFCEEDERHVGDRTCSHIFFRYLCGL